MVDYQVQQCGARIRVESYNRFRRTRRQHSLVVAGNDVKQQQKPTFYVCGTAQSKRSKKQDNRCVLHRVFPPAHAIAFEDRAGRLVSA